MEGFLHLILGYFGGYVFSYISRIHTAYIGEDSSIVGTWNFWWLPVTSKLEADSLCVSFLVDFHPDQIWPSCPKGCVKMATAGNPFIEFYPIFFGVEVSSFVEYEQNQLDYQSNSNREEITIPPTKHNFWPWPNFILSTRRPEKLDTPPNKKR